ncbi:MAG TPA: RsmE family RNA methyltransferase [Acidimicrobiales bacterium]|nr:RsmE family RNA methyltransferase [Acidimicrobiales bacterium]
MSADPPLSSGADPDGTGGPHAFVDDLDDPVLDDADRHHLSRVVRLRVGDPLTVGDGRGSWRPARFGPRVEPTGDVVVVAAPAEPVTVGFALLKGSRIDDVTRHLTELGVDVIVPIATERCVVRWNTATAQKRHRRLERITVEAAMQCRRAWLPTVEVVQPFAAAAERRGAVVAQMGAPPLAADVRCLLVGPEGGFTEAEVALASATASLGAHVLRAETAALAAGTLLADRRATRR